MLTARDTEVLPPMAEAEGRTTTAIADSLVSGGTAEKHVTSTFSRFERAEAPSDHRRVLAVLGYLEV